MALQELSTNAVKHGALSNEVGEIRISWGLDATKTPPHLHLRWERRAAGLRCRRRRGAALGQGSSSAAWHSIWRAMSRSGSPLMGSSALSMRPLSLPIPHRQDLPPDSKEFTELDFRFPSCSKFLRQRIMEAGP
jgi:hypothetical protein